MTNGPAVHSGGGAVRQSFQHLPLHPDAAGRAEAVGERTTLHHPASRPLRNPSITLLVPLVLTALAAPCGAQDNGQPTSARGFRELTPVPAARADSIRAVLRGYIEAVHRRDGPAATRAVTRATRAYYAQMRDLALTAPEEKVRALPLMDRLSVLMYRHRIPAEVLRTLAGDSAFAYTVTAGWVARTAPSTPPPIGEIVGSGDSAMVAGAGPAMRFVREEGAWRWNMIPILRAASEEFAAHVPAGMTEDEFVILILSSTEGRPVPPTIWKPVSP